MGTRTYPVPTRFIPGVGRPTLTEDGLRALAASGAEASEWADAICSRLDARSETVVQSSLTAAGIDAMPGCSYRGLLDPDTDVPVVIHVVRFDPADSGVARWQGSAWEVVPPEYEPAGFEYADLTDDRDLLAQAIEAIGSGGSLALRATSPRGYLSEPGVPMVLTAAAEGEEEAGPVIPPGAKVYAIVDDLDTSAVLDVFFVMAGPSVYRRSAGAWEPANDLLTKLTSVDPPAVVAIDSDKIAPVIAQIDDYDQANPPEPDEEGVDPLTSAATWTEELHPRSSGKFAKKNETKATISSNPRADANEDYIRNGGKRPSGVSALPDGKKPKGAARKAAAKRAAKSGSKAGAPGADPVVEKAQQDLERSKAASADSLDRDRIKQAHADRAERQRREKFQNSLGDQMVQLLNEGRDPRQVEMLLGLRMQAEVARRKKYDASIADRAEAMKIRSMEENLGLRQRQRKVSQLALQRRHARTTTAAANPPAHSAMAGGLKEYWARGKGAAKIRWGTGGDFNRCRKQLAKYLKPGQLAGACANLHKIATGEWPGKGAHGGRLKGAARKKAKKALSAAGARYPEGVMVALYPPEDLASQLALDGGEPPEDLHVTLSYHGKRADLAPEQVASLHRAVAQLAETTAPITGQVGGYGRFLGSDEEGDPIWLAVDAASLPGVREDLVRRLTDAGAGPRTDHGFTPHMTLAYVPKDGSGLEPVLQDPVPLTFDSMVLCVGPDQTKYPLRG